MAQWANYVGKLLSNFKGFYNEINSATLTGAIDVVVVKQEDGSYVSSPFHVRFGKMGVLRAREKVVDIEINGEPADLHMKLGEAGEAFFVEEAEESELPEYLATSPIPSYGDLMEQGIKELKDQASNTGDDGRQRHLTTSSSATDEIPAFSPPKSDADELIDVVTHSTSNNNEKSQQIMSTPEKSRNADSNEEKIPELPQSPSIATQTVMTGNDVEEHKSRTPPRPSPARDSLDGARPLVERMPSVLTGEGGTPPRAPPPIVRLDTKFSDPADDVQKGRRRFRRKKYGSPARSPGRSPVRFESKDSNSSTRGLVKPKALKAVDESKNDPLNQQQEDLFPMDMSDSEETEMTPVGSLEEGLMSMTSMGRTISMPVIQSSTSMTEDWCNSHSASAFHPFSDTDITPITSPIGSRPPSPKSDTEFETQKYDVMSQTLMTGDDFNEDDVKWKWGELPEKTPDPTSKTSDKDKSQKLLSAKDLEDKPKQGLFQFMRKTKKLRHQPEQGGIYLDDLNLDEMDPEVAQLYLYQTKSGPHRGLKDEDNESGRGASLPQSPVSVDSDHGQQRDYLKTYKHDQSPPDISMSLCGGLKENEEISTDRFLQDLVTYDDLCQNPDIMQDSNLVIKIDDKYYNWQIAGPIVMSVVVFQRPIPDHGVEGLIKKHMPKKETKRRGWIWWRTVDESSQTEKKEQATTTSSQPSSATSSPQNSPEKHRERSKRLDDDLSTDEEVDKTKGLTDRGSGRSSFRRNDKYKKSLKLTSEQIEKLGLTEGSNEVVFSVTTQYQGTARCMAYIYVWNWDDRIVVSDIDGTVTKSDVLGHVLPMIGKDWSQAGITKLYQMIANNGYKFLYLSARAIGQSRVTRDYLRSVKQGELELPEGPLLLSPSSLISAFHKEVIERKPEEFKISCLRDISALFPPQRNPFFAGYGNKVNDVWAYRAVGIPISRIFTVNHKGELRMEQLKTTFQSSYTSLTDITDHFFPPLLEKQKVGKMASGNFHGADAYSSFTYWREPLPDIEIDIEAMPDSNSSTTVQSENKS